MLVFHVIVTAALAVILLTALGNLAYLAWVGRYARLRRRADTPLVSVLVPARDEASRIGACLESLAALRCADVEVLVLDDGSADATREVARSFLGRVPGLRVLDGSPLPVGRVGKPHACAQLARESRGEWLLFTDADVTLEPDGIARALAIAGATRADLLTALPRQRLGSFAERLVIPLLYFFVAGFLPMFALPLLRWSRLAAASGQFMLFRREAYDAIGGHESVARELVEDVALARAVRRRRLRLVIANGADLASCRMYTGWAEIVEGFTKNAFAGLGGSVVTLAVLVAALLALFVVPPVLLASSAEWRWPAVEVALALGSRAALAVAFRQPLWAVVFHPFAVLVAIAIALRSFWLTRFGGGVSWRGRRYPSRPS